MRVVCLVPSITETLIECGVDVVARTRYCIHPASKVKNIKVIGGTKSVNWDEAPSCDLVILDKEENKKKMSEACPYPWVATHVESLADLKTSLQELALKLDNENLESLSDRLSKLLSIQIPEKTSLDNFPGVILKNTNFGEQSKLRYLIWSKPFMEVGCKTFISDMLRFLGYSKFLEKNPQKYPEIRELPGLNYALLLSSEPFPFEKQWREKWQSSAHGCALVDGESFSWFGIRSIRFLESCLQKT